MTIVDLDKIGKRKTIIVSATPKQISDIKVHIPQLAESASKIKKIKDDVYKLLIDGIETETPKIMTRFSMGDLASEEVKKEKIADFDKSHEFYDGAKAKKGYKIITDEFSNERNVQLFKGFAAIEGKWRQIIVDKVGLESIKATENPQSYKNSIADHKVSQYSLSEFFESFLFSPASDEYVEHLLRKLKDIKISTVIDLRRLTKIDELSFSISKEDLGYLQGVRNACMHFRVITVDEYKQAVTLINAYLKDEEYKSFMKEFQKIMEPYQSAMNDLVKAVQSIKLPKIDFGNWYKPK